MSRPDRPTVAKRLIAGMLAGASETILTYPAEYCKTARQLQSFGLRDSTSGSKATPLSSLNILRSTYKTSGISGIYSGCAALAVSNTLKSGVRFYSFEIARDQIASFSAPGQGGIPPFYVNTLAGLVAGATESVLVVTPGESLKTKIVHDLQKGAGTLKNQNLFTVTKSVVRKGGIAALWDGLAPVLCKQATNSAVRFTAFSTIRESVERQWPSMAGSVASTILAGAASGIITGYTSMPFDNIKTRMQSGGAKYSSMFDCAWRIFHSEGIGAFWKGTLPRLVRLTLSSAITFTVYERVIQFDWPSPRVQTL